MYTDDPKLAIREAPGLNVAIAKGWSVAIPDHLGPSSAYGAAKLGGQITLDGIRAAQRFDALGLGASPVGMAGYSGRGMARPSSKPGSSPVQFHELPSLSSQPVCDKTSSIASRSTRAHVIVLCSPSSMVLRKKEIHPAGTGSRS